MTYLEKKDQFFKGLYRSWIKHNRITRQHQQDPDPVSRPGRAELEYQYPRYLAAIAADKESYGYGLIT